MAREDAERIAKEQATRLAREEASRKAREDAEREVRAHAEARERARIEEESRQRLELAQRQAREEAERDAGEQIAARERARQEEETVRREIAARQLQEEDAQRKAAEEARRRQVKVEEIQQRTPRAEQDRPAAQARDEQKHAEEEAARYTAALAPHLQAAAVTDDPAAAASTGPAPMGAFSNLASLESGTPLEPADPAASPAHAAADTGARTEQEKAERKHLEKEAKAQAKEEARARKQSEKEAKQLARANRGSGLSGAGISVGKIIAAVLLLTIGAALAYVFSLSADKPAIEKMLSARFATTVTVGDAKFTPFAAELRLVNVMLGDIRLPLVVASADPASLASNDKIWRNVEVTGLELNPAQAEKLAALASTDAGRGAAASFSLQRVRVLGVSITGTPVAVPKFDANLLVAANGALKQATLALPDGRAQVLLAPDEKGWLVDFESRGVEWPLGPKAPWESLRGKGIATRGGIKIDEFTMTLGGGVARGSGELGWTNGWKYTGTVDVSGIDAEAISTAIYGTAPLSGPLEGKFDVSLAATALNRLFASPQLDGNFTLTKVVFKTVDFARLLQGNDPAGGQTRLPEMTGSLSASGGRLQVRQLRGSSGLLTLSGGLDVSADRALAGTVNVELGAAGSRGRSSLRVGGTLAEPRFGK